MDKSFALLRLVDIFLSSSDIFCNAKTGCAHNILLHTALLSKSYHLYRNATNKKIGQTLEISTFLIDFFQNSSSFDTFYQFRCFVPFYKPHTAPIPQYNKNGITKGPADRASVSFSSEAVLQLQLMPLPLQPSCLLLLLFWSRNH